MPSQRCGRGVSTSPDFHPRYTATGKSSNPWDASGSVHQSRTRVTIGSQNKITNASPAIRPGTGVDQAAVHRRSAVGVATVVRSPRSLAEDHHWCRLDHDLQVLDQRVPLDVLEIVRDFATDIVHVH